MFGRLYFQVCTQPCQIWCQRTKFKSFDHIQILTPPPMTPNVRVSLCRAMHLILEISCLIQWTQTWIGRHQVKKLGGLFLLKRNPQIIRPAKKIKFHFSGLEDKIRPNLSSLVYMRAELFASAAGPKYQKSPTLLEIISGA